MEEYMMRMRDLPGEVRGILADLERLEEELSAEGSGWGIAERISKRNGFGKKVNIIPVGVPDRCRDCLLVVIGSRKSEDVEKYILQAIEHIHAKCRGITRYVIFWAAKWDSMSWREHASSFRNVLVVLKPFYAAPTALKY